MTHLRPYDPRGDRSIVENLWTATLAPTWPLLPRGIDALRTGLVAETGGEPIGFIAIDDRGSVPLILVAPSHQRRGVGRALLAAALERLAPTGKVRAGSGGADYIWPGAPLDLPAAVAFFTRQGWFSVHDCLDLTQDLRGYQSPTDVYARAGVALSVATAAELPEVGEFESTHFPNWARWFDGGSGDILLARDHGGRIVSTLLYSAADPGCYEPMLGPHAGIIGCVGVAPDVHGRGVGTAIVARASELLRDAGTRTCFVGWAVRDRFYGRLGYRPWRRYRMFETGPDTADWSP
jgi:beta-N-acetylhexosaminidase